MLENIIDKAVWYVRGEKEQIKDLLNDITHIGKKAQSQGKGQVGKWIVEEVEHDYSVFKDGKLMKTVPLEYFEATEASMNNQMVLIESPFRPPYWLVPPHPKADIRTCVMNNV